MENPEFSIFLVKNGLIDKADESFKQLMEWSASDLFRQPLSFLFPADAHGRLDRLLELNDGVFDEVVFPQVPLRLKSGGYINFDMKIEERNGDRMRLDFFKPGRGRKNPPKDDEPADLYSFYNFVERLLNSPYDGDLDLTMISLDALRDGSPADLTDGDRDAARADIEARLREKAVGNQIGQLDEASYGLVTAGDFDVEAFEEELKNVAVRLNLDPAVLSAKSANVKIDDRELDPEKLRQALNHSRGVFLGEIDDDTELTSISGVIDGIEHNRRLIQDALKRYHFLATQRLVMDNKRTVSIGRLQQGKVNLEKRIRSPDEIVVMADHPDISLPHDLAQLERIFAQRKQLKPHEKEKLDYYEVCRSSIIQEEFLAGLETLLEKFREDARLIGFRVKGVPPAKHGGPHWSALNRLAAKGHPIWIDRFGDAVVTIEALDCLQNGFVEVPPAMMRKLAKHFDGEDLMRKLIATWRERLVNVISADLPDYEMKSLAQKLGITIALEDPPEPMLE